MATGTGYPLPKTGGLLQAPGVTDAEKGAGNEWLRIAKAGEGLASATGDLARQETHEAQIGYLADREVEGRDFFTKLRDQRANDPNGYETDARQFIDGKLSQAQPWAVTHLKKFYSSQMEGGLASTLAEKRSSDKRDNAASLNALADSTESRIISLAMAGQASSAEAADETARLRGSLDAARNAGLMTQEQIDQRLGRVAGRATMESVVRSAKDIYEASGFDLPKAEAELRRGTLENTSISSDPDEKLRMFSRGRQELHLIDSVRRADRLGVVEVSRDVRERLKAGIPVDQAEVDGTIAALDRTGAGGERMALSKAWAERSALGTLAQAGGLPDQVRLLNAARALRTSASVGEPGSDVTPAGLIRRFEGFRAAPYFDVNAHRVGYGSDTVTGPDGTVAKVAPETRVSRDDAERDLNRRVGEFQNGIVADVGAEAWNKLAPNVQAALTSVAYNYGRLPTAVAMAVSTGGDVAKAIEGLKGHNGGVNAERRLQEAAIARGGALAPSGDVQAVAGAIRAAQAQVLKDARSAWTSSYKPMIDQGRAPDLEGLLAVKEAANLSNDPKWKQEVATAIGSIDLSKEIAKLPPEQGRALLDRIKGQIEGEGGYTPDTFSAVKFLEHNLDATRKAMADDRIGAVAAQSGGAIKAPLPLELSSVDAMRAGLAERGRIDKVAQERGWGAGSVLRPSDADQIVTALRGDPKNAGVVLAGLATVPSDNLPATLATRGLKDAIVGLTRSGDPAKMTVAFSYLDQQQKRDPLTFKSTYGDQALRDLEFWNARGRFLPSDQLTEWVKRRSDPEVQANREAAYAEADKKLKNVTPKDVLAGFGTKLVPNLIDISIPGAPVSDRPGEPPQGLLNDFKTEFREAFADLGDEAKAKEVALKRIGEVWGKSSVAGGILMRHAPEKAYQPINGSHDYIGRQLDAAVKEFAGVRGISLAPLEVDPLTGGPIPVAGETVNVRGQRIVSARRYLVSDRDTEADVAAGRAASYQVVVMAPDGRYHLLERQDGKALRFFADRPAAADEARTTFEDKLRAAAPDFLGGE